MAWWDLLFSEAGSLGIARAKGTVIAKVMETRVWFLPVYSWGKAQQWNHGLSSSFIL